MHLTIYSAIRYCWLALVIVWIIGLRNTKSSVRIQATSGRVFDLAVILLGFAFIGTNINWFRQGWLGARLIPDLFAFQVAAIVLTIAGLLFAIWARFTLGTNWSGEVTVKADHELIVRGPYALVRHPIYTGLLLATVGTVLAGGQWRCVVGLPLVLLGFTLKIATEERMMSETFPDAYPQYRLRVKALIPGVF